MKKVILTGALVLLLAVSVRSEGNFNSFSFNFTFTAPETSVTDTVVGKYFSIPALLTNTGTEPDTYGVIAYVNWSSTPANWQFHLCARPLPGVCVLESTLISIPLEALASDSIFVDFRPNYWLGIGEAKVKISSAGNPSLVDSITFHYTAQVSYTCGDANVDGVVDIGDIVFLINYVFYSGPAPQPVFNAADVNSDGVVDIGDIVYLISYVFYSGPLPYCTN
jgi:hypothetical protein